MSTLTSTETCLCDRPIDRSSDRTVVTKIEGPLALIIINRPESLNALTPDMIREITESVESLDRSDEIAAIAIVGCGKAFSAGCDVVSLYNCVSSPIIAPARRRLSGGRSVAISDFMDRGRACVRAIQSCTKPVIAGVEGWCLGGGFEISLACDFVFASDDAVFGFPEVKLGLIPGFGGTQLATTKLGAARAKELIMTGRRIDLLTAFEWGLINRTVASGELLDSIKDFAEGLSRRSPKALKAAKRSINAGQGDSEVGMKTEREEFLDCFSDPFTKSNMAAFSERSVKIK